MKIDLVTEQSETHGLEVSAMDIDVAKRAKLFHMLSNTLYSDKISSIIRELSSNAYDSHLARGNLDVPFVLRAPTFEKPFFEIRDYGIGLTYEKALKTILCYLGSDKDDSEDFIGGWGIGSKSPFAYASSYEVKVFKDGKFAHFTCWKNESGIPDKAVLDSGETDEPDGVQMIVPVEMTDINLFNQSMRQYMDWTNYNVQMFVDDQEYMKRECVASKEFENYTIKVYRQGSGKRRLVYGGFSYDMAQCVDNRYDYSSSWRSLDQNLHHAYDIAFVIDTPNLVSFNMNREVLEQTQKSKTFIKQIVDDFAAIASTKKQIFERYSNQWLTSVNNTKNFIELQATIDKILEEVSSAESTFDLIFRTGDSKLQYTFVGSVQKISSRGVYDLHRVSVELTPVLDQFVFAWGKRVRPGPTDRSSFMFNIDKKKTVLYVKAKSEDEARERFKSIPDFVGLNFDEIDLQEVSITTSARKASIPRARRSSDKPVVVCKKSKRLSFDYDTTYVMVNDDDDISNFDTITATYIEKQSVVLFYPTEKTKQNVEDFTNFITLDELEETAEAWFQNMVDSYIDDKLRYRLWKFLYVRPPFEDNGFVEKEWSEIRSRFDSLNTYVLNRFQDPKYLDFRTLFFKKLEGNSTVRKLQKDIASVIIKAKKTKKFSELLNVEALMLDESKEADDIKALLSNYGINI